MSEPIKKIESISWTGEAVTILKVPGKGLAKAFQLDIVDGILVGVKQLTRAADLPTIAIGHGQRILWKQYRKNELPEDLT